MRYGGYILGFSKNTLFWKWNFDGELMLIYYCSLTDNTN